jgi:hypothetical protein
VEVESEMMEVTYKCSECSFSTTDEKVALSHICPAPMAVTITTTAVMTAAQKDKAMSTISAKLAEFLSAEYRVESSTTAKIDGEAAHG